MKYLLLLAQPPDAGESEGWDALNDEMRQAGVYVVASGIEAPDAASTLRAPGGDRVLTDGPFAETEEVLFGFYVIDVPDLDAAVEWAAKMPSAAHGSVEIRPTVGFELP